MDVLGKWSLLDIFFMVILLVAFQFELGLGRDITIVLYVEPRWGFYSFLLATILSLLLGHSSLYVHRLDESQGEGRHVTRETRATEGVEEIGEQEAVMNHVFGVTVWNCSCSVCEQKIEEGESGSRLEETESPTRVGTRTGETLTEALIGESQQRSTEDQERGLSRQGRVIAGEASVSHLLCPPSPVQKTLEPTSPSPVPSPVPSPHHHHRYFRVTILGKIAVVILLLFAYSIIILACLRTTFSFEFRGLAGYLLQDKARSSYSVLNLGQQLPTASTTPHNPLILWLQSCYFLYTILMPLLFLISLLFLWLQPLTYHQYQSALVLVEVLLAWSSLDVFAIAMVASVFEISQFAQFMIGDACDDLNKILREYFDDELAGDDVCFDVIASLQQVSWCLY
jgi:hypothetical protein